MEKNEEGKALFWRCPKCGLIDLTGREWCLICDNQDDEYELISEEFELVPDDDD